MTHASLFSGIGGPEVAAEMLGWTNLFHCEINPSGRAVLAYHFPESVSYEDITKTDFTQWRGRVDILTGGFPCQPFSYAGKRGGADDDRYLWPQMCRAIQECQPTWVVGENVAGLATMVEQCEITELGAQPTLFEAVEAVPESLYEERDDTQLIESVKILKQSDTPSNRFLFRLVSSEPPHRRDRIFIVGHRNTADTDLQRRNQPEPTTEPSEKERQHCQTNTDGRDTKRNVTDTADPGTESVRRERQDTVHGLGLTPDAAGIGGREIHEHLEPELTERQESISESSKRNATNAADPRTEGVRREWQDAVPGCEEVSGCGRWQGFPSVSAVHRGNDGIPFNVDDLTIPFAQWRTESLKAYGNAIVPQVMYEIFRAIDKIERN